MITNFEQITSELNETDLQFLDKLILGFKNRGIENPINESEILERMNRLPFTTKLTGARLRKLVNHIRSNALIPLIATPKGYFTSMDQDEIKKQVQSLHDRSEAILRAANGLERFLIV